MWIDTKDEAEQMTVLTGYKKSGIMTANEVRAKLGLSPIEGWDVLVVDAQASQRDALQDLMKTEAGAFYKNLTDLENDLYSHLQTPTPKGNWKVV